MHMRYLVVPLPFAPGSGSPENIVSVHDLQEIISMVKLKFMDMKTHPHQRERKNGQRDCDVEGHVQCK
jgi:hypothetical protein